MGKKNNRVCIICGQTYTFCPVCNSQDKNKPSWYFIFNNQNCHDIYEVCVDYRDNKIDAKEAYKRISKLNISNLESFNETTKAQIKEILLSNEKIEKKSIDEKPKEEITKNSKK